MNEQKTSITIPFSHACERNKDPILEVIKPHLSQFKSVLEIGSGTGQHAVYFAQQLPHLIWQTSDQREYLGGIAAQLSNAKSASGELDNLPAPIELNVNQRIWLANQQRFDAIYTANTLHIMNWDDVQAFFAGLPQVCHQQIRLIIYGPFKYQGQFTSKSNLQFDQSLRSRGVGSAIRDFEAVDKLAKAQGFNLIEDVAMPANNQCLIWQST